MARVGFGGGDALFFARPNQKGIPRELRECAVRFVRNANRVGTGLLGPFQDKVRVGGFTGLGNGDDERVAEIQASAIRVKTEGAASETGMPVVISIK